jgi:hypothetical protein
MEVHMEERLQPVDKKERILFPRLRNYFRPMNLDRANPEECLRESGEEPPIPEEIAQPKPQEDDEYLEGPLAEVVQDYLAYTERRRPNPPSVDHLPAKDQAKAEEMLDLLAAFSEKPELDQATVPDDEPWVDPEAQLESVVDTGLDTASQTGTQPTLGGRGQAELSPARHRVLVSYHAQHRGWANFVIFVIEEAGLPCVAKPCDQEPAKSFIQWANLPVVLIISAHSTAELELLRLLNTQHYDNPMMPRVIPVVVDDSKSHVLSAVDHVSFVGATENTARRALLRRVTGREEVLSEQTYTSALQVLLQRMVREDQATAELVQRLGSTSTLDIGYCHHGIVGASPDRDATVTGDDLKQAVSVLRGRLSRKDRARCAEVAWDLAALAEVRLRLGNEDEAARDLRQAKTVLDIAHVGRRGKGGQSNALISRSSEELRKRRPELASRYSLC